MGASFSSPCRWLLGGACWLGTPAAPEERCATGQRSGRGGFWGQGLGCAPFVRAGAWVFAGVTVR
jgi:hypothetical protein